MTTTPSASNTNCSNGNFWITKTTKTPATAIQLNTCTILTVRRKRSWRSRQTSQRGTEIGRSSQIVVRLPP